MACAFLVKVGLTGGIGCGKSTVVGLFRNAGWQALESDQIVRDLLATDPVIKEAIRKRWGGEVILEKGGVNRRAVAEHVFANKNDLLWLESLLHPLVRSAWQGEVASRPDVNWLVEIPLLFEKSLETVFDLTVCVSSPPDVVETRMAARGYTGEEVDRRRQRQMPLEDKMRLADHVITNAGSLEFLEQQTKRLIAQISGIQS
ncbi:MAG: dephospho-CoA kinase [Verrucomicrobiota bacterium]